MTPRAGFALALFAFCLFACRKPAPPTPVAVDAAVFDSKEVADRSLQTNCGVCHTDDMIRSQRLTRAQWEKEIKKMSGWGAQIPPAEMPLVVDRLTETLGADAPAFAFAAIAAADVPALVAPDPTLSAGDAVRGAAAYAGACQGCHGPTGSGAVGPNLLERPVLHRAADFQKIVREGRQKMPAFAATFDAKSIDDLRAFLQSRRDD